MMEKAIPKTSIIVKFLFNSCLYPSFASTAASSSFAKSWSYFGTSFPRSAILRSMWEIRRVDPRSIDMEISIERKA